MCSGLCVCTVNITGVLRTVAQKLKRSSFIGHCFIIIALLNKSPSYNVVTKPDLRVKIGSHSVIQILCVKIDGQFAINLFSSI